MLLTISTTHTPATDLGYLLYKHPQRVQTFRLPFGAVHVFYPQVSDERCTAALLLDVDPVALVRGRDRGARGRPGSAGEGLLQQYVNDRPYVASSFLSVAIAQVFGSALAGRCTSRPDLPETPLPLEARLAVLPCRGGEEVLRRLFEPLGYAVTAQGHPLDPRFPEWGPAPYFTVGLAATVPLRALLSHLYVLVPVLDDEKHYWVGDDEVEKLLRHGAAWLPGHPERELIARRYLKRRRDLAGEALARLAEGDAPDPDAAAAAHAAEEEAVEARLETPETREAPLGEQRLRAVLGALKGVGARRVLDLGCGSGTLMRALLADGAFERVVGVDASYRALLTARDRLRLDRLSPLQRGRVDLLHGALTYRDRRLAGFDAAAVVEVVEHLDTGRLAAFERVLFEHARPGAVVLTTPNREYNVRFPTLPANGLRHRDHRFEWTRAELRAWAGGVAERFGYDVTFGAVGKEDAEVGPPTQLALFTRREGGPVHREGGPVHRAQADQEPPVPQETLTPHVPQEASA